MSHRSIQFRAIAASVVPLLLMTAGCSPTPSSLEPPAAEAEVEDAPQAPTHPDFSGVWMAFAVENPDSDADDETAGPGAGNAPRYSAEGTAMLDAFAAQFREIPEPGGNCVGTGMPGVMLSTVSYPVQIVQNDSLMLMVAELETQVRRVFLDGRGHPDNFFPTMIGHSIGAWEGDTLVIDTALLERWELRPWPRSGDTHIIERVHQTTLDQINARPTGFVADLDAAIDDDVLVFDITLTDPVYYDGPQRRIAYYQRVADTATAEYDCIKGLWLEKLDAQRIPE
jgi:hypothetical protein